VLKIGLTGQFRLFLNPSEMISISPEMSGDISGDVKIMNGDIKIINGDLR